MTDELFHEELVAMHLQEQDYRAEHSTGWANWFGSKPDERREYRLRARLMTQEAMTAAADELAASEAQVSTLSRQLEEAREALTLSGAQARVRHVRMFVSTRTGEFRASEVPRGDYTNKQIYNTLGYLRRTGELERLGYGKFRRAKETVSHE